MSKKSCITSKTVSNISANKPQILHIKNNNNNNRQNSSFFQHDELPVYLTMPSASEYHKYTFLINKWRRSFEAQNNTVATLFTHMNEINVQILNDEETSNEPEACQLYQSCQFQNTAHSTHCSLVIMHHLVQLSTHDIITFSGS